MDSYCMICLEKINSTEDLSALRCGHLFHSGCITKWINEKNDCPKCRRRTTSDSIIKLFVETPDGSQRCSMISDLQAQIRELNSLLDNQSKIVAELKNQSEEAELSADFRSLIDALQLHVMRRRVENLVAESASYESMRKLMSDKQREWKKELEKYEVDDDLKVRGLAAALATTKAELKSRSSKCDYLREKVIAKDKELDQLLVKKRNLTCQVDRLSAKLAENERQRKESRDHRFGRFYSARVQPSSSTRRRPY